MLALNRPGTSAPVAPTTTEPTATAAPTPSTTSPAPDPSTATQTTPAVVVPTTIPEGFLLPHEGEPAPENSDVTAWTEAEPVPLRACEEGLPNMDLPVDTPPTDQRWIAQSGPE